MLAEEMSFKFWEKVNIQVGGPEYNILAEKLYTILEECKHGGGTEYKIRRSGL